MTQNASYQYPPIMTASYSWLVYGSQIWRPLQLKDINPVKSLQHCATKYIIHLPLQSQTNQVSYHHGTRAQQRLLLHQIAKTDLTKQFLRARLLSATIQLDQVATES